MKLFLPPTSAEWAAFFAIFCGLGVFILAAEFLRSRFSGSPEITRKLVHIATGMLICFTPRFFVSGVPPMLLAASFMVINYAAIRAGILKGIHGTNRASFGTVYYPFSFFVLVLLSWDSAPYFLSISMLILALADAAAAIVGENLKAPSVYHLTSDKKSIQGSAAMFVTTWVIAYGGILFFVPPEIPIALPVVLIAFAVAAFVTAWEAISSAGLDNLTIPLAAGFVLDACITPRSYHHPDQFMYGIVFGAAIAAVSYRMKLLTASGAVATFLLAVIIFGIGGWLWTLPIVVFFLASSLLSRVGGKRKLQYEAIYEKSNMRDAGQVAANGGIAAALAVVWYMFPSMTFVYLGFVGAIAAATADTWGTEIGTLASGNPRSIVSFKSVEKGTSGGVSLTGVIGGILGALLIAASALLFSQPQSMKYFAAVTIAAGLIGTLTDSMLGATLQAQYQCPACGKNTEKQIHCSSPTELVRGLPWMNNDMVNWACAAAGGAAAMLSYAIM
jgi:uncharacterized protein (TIGR00297 family)